MELIFYLLTLAGSSSFGYSLLRTGFPKTQSLQTINKIIYGYGAGLVVVVPSVITAVLFGEGSFFLMLGVIYGLLFAILLVRRISFDDHDSFKLIKKEKQRAILPKKILTKDEKENSGRVKKITENIVNKPIVSSVKIKEHIFKEKQPNVIAQLRKKTTKIENESKQQEKEEALKKMKSFAKQIDKKKVAKKKDDIDEDELSNLGEGF
jgi:hypothetical protein